MIDTAPLGPSQTPIWIDAMPLFWSVDSVGGGTGNAFGTTISECTLSIRNEAGLSKGANVLQVGHGRTTLLVFGLVHFEWSSTKGADPV